MEAERHTFRALMTTGLAAEFAQIFYEIRWLFIIVFLLIIFDLYYGIRESRKKYDDTKNERYKVRLSKAGRRTLNKTVDYICYVVIAGVLAKAEGEVYGASIVVVSSIACLFIISFELSSIIGHICYLHNMPYLFNPKTLIVSLIRKKDKDLGDAVDEAITEKKDNEKDNT